MSRRKQQAKGVLGPNGRPVNAPPPKPRPILGPDSKPLPASTPRITALVHPSALSSSDWYTAVKMQMNKMLYGPSSTAWSPYSLLDVAFDRVEPSAPKAQRPDPYAGLDLGDLSDFESGVEELPEGTLDMTRYTDAFYVAAKECQHHDYEDTVYAKREARCNDCGKYFKRPKSMFGW